MDRTNFLKLKDTLEDYNQFKKSNLQPDIMSVLNCDYKEAYEVGKTHCNMLSTWALVYAQDLYTGDYAEFFKMILVGGCCNKFGYLYLDKPELFKRFNISCKIKKYDTIPYDLKEYQFFQIAVNKKTHFMASATDESKNIFLFDTNNRPYGDELVDALAFKNDKIDWFKKFEAV